VILEGSRMWDGKEVDGVEKGDDLGGQGDVRI
jgi:hypothetical protein